MISQANRGKALENLIEAANAVYEFQNVAIIQKIPTPTKVVRAFDPASQKSRIVSAFHEKKSTVDFVGVVMGGKSVAFDAKSTLNKTMLRLDAIEPHQYDFLEKFQEIDGVSFLIVEFAEVGEIYRIDFDTVKRAKKNGKKNILLSDIRKECQRCSQTGVNPLHYLINLV